MRVFASMLPTASTVALIAVASLCSVAWPARADSRLPAFPGAEGFGRFAQGGRGGDVYIVTNLLDDGPGSLRHGLQTAEAPRTIVFEVSGVIDLQQALRINKPYLTIAGQTAPGTGITLKGWCTYIHNTHDIIIRHLRFRPGDINCGNGYIDDALWIWDSHDVIIDHVSASWGVDEVLSLSRGVTDITIQNTIISESLNDSCNEKEVPHGFGSNISWVEDANVTYHGNLLIHHTSRNPRPGGTPGHPGLRFDFVNNVVYNWGRMAGYTGKDENTEMNYVANYFIAGPSTDEGQSGIAFRGGDHLTRVHQNGNLIDSNRNGIRDGIDTGWGMFDGTYTRSVDRFPYPAVTTLSATEAYERQLRLVGASHVRDDVDHRLIDHLRREAGGIIDSQADVGGWPRHVSLPPPPDTDRDGIPDEWEQGSGLDPLDSTDGSLVGGDGQTMLEIYLNSLLKDEGR